MIIFISVSLVFNFSGLDFYFSHHISYLNLWSPISLSPHQPKYTTPTHYHLLILLTLPNGNLDIVETVL